MNKNTTKNLSVFQRYGVEIYIVVTFAFFLVWAGTLPAAVDGNMSWQNWSAAGGFLVFLTAAIRADVVRFKMYDSERLSA